MAATGLSARRAEGAEGELTSGGTGLWSEVHRQPTRGSEDTMSGKSPQERGSKKAAKMSMKEKRAAKREKREPSTFIKPRKDARV